MHADIKTKLMSFYALRQAKSQRYHVEPDKVVDLPGKRRQTRRSAEGKITYHHYMVKDPLKATRYPATPSGYAEALKMMHTKRLATYVVYIRVDATEQIMMV